MPPNARRNLRPTAARPSKKQKNVKQKLLQQLRKTCKEMEPLKVSNNALKRVPSLENQPHNLLHKVRNRLNKQL